jgi:hypothetical protein
MIYSNQKIHNNGLISFGTNGRAIDISNPTGSIADYKLPIIAPFWTKMHNVC